MTQTPINHCRSCGAEIVWQRTEAGKAIPVSVATGESHFRDCPQASQWSKSKPKKTRPVPSDQPLPF